MSSNEVDDQPPSPKLVPHNTLMGLPDELITKIIAYAVTSDSEAINYYAETLEQDLARMRAKLLAPFAHTPKLRVMAEAEYSPFGLIYRTSMPNTRRLPPYLYPCLGPGPPLSDKALIDNDSEPSPRHIHEARNFWFDTRFISDKVVACADHLTHLEILVPRGPSTQWHTISTYGLPALPRPTRTRERAVFGQMARAFPNLQTLVVRVTTYQYSSETEPYPDVPTQQLHNARRPNGPQIIRNRVEFFAGEMQFNIATLVRVVDGICHDKLREKTMILFQKEQRDWRHWRDGPLNEPAFEIDLSDDDGLSDIDGLVWRMMDLPSCRVTF